MVPSSSLKISLLFGVVLVNASNLRNNYDRKLADPRSVERKIETVNYLPSNAEQYVLDNHGPSTSGCDIYTKPESKIRNEVMAHIGELQTYYDDISARKEFAPDVRTLFDIDYSNKEDVCHTYSDPSSKSNDLSTEYFTTSKEISHSSTQGFMEPLLPPFRHPAFCIHEMFSYRMDFLVEDFGHICRQTLTRESKTAFIDIGATYNFVDDKIDHGSPVIQVIEKYRKFGIHFDDIYAYEIQEWDVERVYKTIPDHMRQPMHWINTGVSTEPGHMFNPWTTVLENYKPEDFVVVKLDIDTPSVELQLVQQLLDDPRLHELVDVFYFEHHVQMDEMEKFWIMDGSMSLSLTYFRALRNVGIASHYWV
eukprot:CAMPEP_0194133230 /NCGR_PEP_ID=MMETSP0152-20130528/3487_1 /TAXON_ID=1049557 /ORGANISM="Thalassiothrix antarctica, Strain L6-D1" /LENGTH=364 /DNA_ID=CAMNT_0038828505 /DNA_START=81 /DNA_END=1175 /DNA_ORIENTATION=+